MQLRIGQGYDVHQLVEGRKLILGGIEVPFNKGLKGHSDGDALLHAITDALIGALGLGDIGTHFPDTSSDYKDADSQVLLKKAYQIVLDEGWILINLDSTIITEQPKLKPYIEIMKKNIATVLNCSPNLVNIKGKTNEKLGYLGRGEAIETQAVVLLKKENK